MYLLNFSNCFMLLWGGGVDGGSEVYTSNTRHEVIEINTDVGEHDTLHIQ